MARGEPLLDVELAHGPVEESPGRELWRLRGQVGVGGREVVYDQRLVVRPDGRLEVRTADAAVLVDADRRRIVVDARTESLARQLVTTYALPLLLHAVDVPLLHACAVVAPGSDRATVIAGPSGAGKSSLLVALIDAGWRAVTEDVGAVDPRGTAPAVWPGPPWVRRDTAGPHDAGARFVTPDKTAWDIAPHQVDSLTPIGRVVFLQPAGGDAAQLRTVEPSDAIAMHMRTLLWLGEPSERVGATWGGAVRLANACETVVARFPRSADWLDGAVAALTTL